MLTMSRNIALGYGMSVSDGQILSNGTQPLTTLIWSIGYWLTNGDKYWGVAIMQILSVVIGIWGALLVHRLFTRVLKDFKFSNSVPLLLSGIWFSSHLTINFFHNCLETGLYFCFVFWFLLSFSEVFSNEEKSKKWTNWIKLGAIGGRVLI